MKRVGYPSAGVPAFSSLLPVVLGTHGRTLEDRSNTTVPFSYMQPAPAVDTPPLTAQRDPVSSRRHRRKPMARLLLVHGDAEVARKTARELQEHGHEVMVETEAHRAWRRLRMDPPDVLLVCLSPTGNPGLDAAAATKVTRLKALDIVFYDVPPRLQEEVRREYPRAVIATRDNLLDSLP